MYTRSAMTVATWLALPALVACNTGSPSQENNNANLNNGRPADAGAAPCVADDQPPRLTLSPGGGIELPASSDQVTVTLDFDEAVTHRAPILLTVDNGAELTSTEQPEQLTVLVHSLAPGLTTLELQLQVIDECGNALDYSGAVRISVQGSGPTGSPCPGPAGSSQFPFADVTQCAGLGGASHGALVDYMVTGQTWGDYDRDGWQDLYVTSSTGANHLYRNRGDGTFEVSALAPQVSLDMHPSGGAVFVDYDNDGWKDLYVNGLGPNVLLKNLQGQGFADVTVHAGVGTAGKSESASFGDYDGDGHLDLYVANWLCDHQCPGLSAPTLDRLYHNNGDGTFTDVSDLLGEVARGGAGFVATFSDLDNDGDLDIYLANDKGAPDPLDPLGPMLRNVLWRNDGPGCGGWCFTEVAPSMGADARLDTMGLAVGDYDCDGDLDLFMSHSGPGKLLRNDGAAGFVDVTDAANVSHDAVGWGAAFVDFDNDGLPDLYSAVGAAGFASPHNRLFRNVGGGAFVDLAPGAAGELLGFTVGVNYADYDRDGGLDLILGNMGSGYRLLRNLEGPRSGHHFLSVRLQGAGPVNRDGVGARVLLHSSDGRTQLQEVKLGSSLGGSNDLALHFGLGAATVDELTVQWPDGTTQSLLTPDVNQEHLITYAN